MVCRISPSSPPPADAIMLAAHLDSMAGSPGASDAGSGVATLLETLRAIAHTDLSAPTALPMRHSVIALFNGAEEMGLQVPPPPILLSLCSR